MSEEEIYSQYRNTIKSGDLLVWSDNGQSFFSELFLSMVRIFTASDFAHVGIAVKINNRLFVLEATLPKVQLIPVSNYDHFYHISMGVDWNVDHEDFLYSKIGIKYSLFDAIRAYLGIVKLNNDKWQCAELATEFYKTAGFNFTDTYTPTKLVNFILESDTKFKLTKVKRIE